MSDVKRVKYYVGNISDKQLTIFHPVWVADGVTYSFGIFYDEFLEYFNEGKGPTSWILSVLVGVTLCSGPMSSSFVNRYGCRVVTIAGAILASGCLVISFWAQNVITLCFTIGIGTGIGFGLIYLPAIVSVTTYFEKKRSLATGIAVCGSGFGTFIFAPIISQLLKEYGWRGSILIIAGIVLECIIFGALFRPLEESSIPKPKNILTIKGAEAETDIHVSNQNMQQFAPRLFVNGNNMHRPHSMGHFSIPRMFKHEPNGNIPSEKESADITRLALSQPMLTQSETHYRHHHYGSQSLRRIGPLDRPDGEDGTFIERRHSTFSHKRRRRDTDEEDTVICGIVPCSQQTKNTLQEMLNFSLFKDVVFVIFLLSNLMTSIGFNIPYVYIVPKAKQLGVATEKAGMLISIIGGANTIGRIVLGYISDKPWINRLYIYNWCLTICGLATFLSAFCTTFYSLAIYGTVFGFTIGAYVGLTSVILADLLGLEKLTNAFGLLLLFQGISSLVGPPIAGSLFDWTNSYNPGFYLAGVSIALSGLILFTIPPVQRYLTKKSHNRKKTPAVI
ncbi:hypothetical protein NQ317_000751 [Molorchus minor]|uniref:Major facilitator superfamily (MFS) profile domain-containing protein n=1 Tax=Molorchus minor TaxID=1323400 RepID=A0ABQ9J6G0_9CUCU|nr:hypothetical protein NQ317_000751 [Molorchus minor]